MPALTTGKVLVTGANGYIAAWIIKDLLEHGYAVRGTVRSENKAGYLREYFKAFGDRLEIVVVEDITVDGAFDGLTADIDAIAHTASPVQPSNGDPSEVIRPAVQGTGSVLASALLHRARVRRVLVLSSAVALSLETQADTTVVLDESSWNEYSVARCGEKGRDAEPMHKYCASKVLAERAAWDFYEGAKKELSEKGETLGWDLAVFCPPFVFGPVIHDVPSLETFGRTQADWYKRVVKGETGGPVARQPANFGFDFVDVRDLAKAFVLGLEKEKAGGERFIIRSGGGTWQDFTIAAGRYSNKIPPGDESYKAENTFYPRTYIAEKSMNVLGIRYHTLDELTRDSLADFETRGWL